MKIFKISILSLLGGVLLLNSSCKKTFFTSANDNPNAPKTMVPSALLSAVEGSLAYAQGGDMSRYASMIMQQTYGAYNQSSAYYQYVIVAQDVDQLWGNMYTAVMMNDDSLMVMSDRQGFNAYSGVSRILMAYSLQITVDCWGNIPYSYAFGGGTNLKPTYDVDKDLYAKILALCDDGIAKLDSSNAGFLTPGAEDILYGGDVTKWIKFAHAIKARIYMHQSKNNAAMASSALAEIAQSFTSNADNASYAFTGNTETSANPWYQFNEQRGDISFVSSTLASNLWGTDPRLTILIDTINDVTGPYYGSRTSPVEFITYDELQFMTAEATLTNGGAIGTVQAAYQNAISANMTKLGVATADIDSYLVNNGTLSASTALSQISDEEYVALYLNPEAWVLWRRTGYPALTPVSGSSVPRRLLYPQTEVSYNKANTPSSTLFTPLLFWDK